MKIIKQISIVLIILPLLSMAILNIDLDTKSVLENKVKIKVPKNFNELSVDEINLKYPGRNKPGAVFSNELGTVNITLEIKTDPASQDMIEKYVSNYNDLFVKMYKLGYEKENNSGVINVNNRKVGFVRILMPNKQKKKDYALMFFTDLESKLLMCTFYCPEGEVEKWKVTAEEIMNSIKIK